MDEHKLHKTQNHAQENEENHKAEHQGMNHSMLGREKSSKHGAHEDHSMHGHSMPEVPADEAAELQQQGKRVAINAQLLRRAEL